VRNTGETLFGRSSLAHPAEQISWDDCARVLGWSDLELPTEAQWEYGARAGTDTPWWTGADKRSIAGASNLADGYAKHHPAIGPIPMEEWLDDGYSVHAPVDAMRANPFGLHNVIGNVWEWCRDGFDPHFYALASAHEPQLAPLGHARRVFRGGCFRDTASSGRSALRRNATASHKGDHLGVRPGRVLR
jgi:sulfatase modifying factor 1